jgi:sigma-E factor negative regulatory protein RseC
MVNRIEHKGTVQSADNQRVVVRIEQTSACSGCHARGSCMSSADGKTKLIEVADNTGRYAAGDEVTVVISSSKGFLAVFLAFILPLILVVASVLVFTSVSGSEITGAIAGIASLLPYWLIIYLLRNKINRKITFSLSATLSL